MVESQMILFAADLYLLSKEEGGRHTPVKSGSFRTDVRFKDAARFCSISFDEEFMSPGEKGKVNIEVLLHGEDEVKYLLSLDQWLLYDGERNIGVISNSELIVDPK